MGIFKAAGGAVGGVLADQWLEAFSCDALPDTVLAQPGAKQTGARSSNTKGDGNVISAGSKIMVADGQCAVAVESGKVIGVYDTPGEHTFQSGRTGSIFSGGGLGSLARQTAERIGFGGDMPISQSIQYLNMKEIPGNAFSFERTVSLVNAAGNLSLDVPIRFAGAFSFRVSDPLTFYKSVCRSRTGAVTVESVLPQLTGEFASAAVAALAELFTEGLTAAALIACAPELREAVSVRLTEKWEALRGFRVVSAAFSQIAPREADIRLLQQLDVAETLSDPAAAAGYLAAAQADAVRAAAQNAAKAVPVNVFLRNNPSARTLWRCACGSYCTGRFCEKCGAKRE